MQRFPLSTDGLLFACRLILLNIPWSQQCCFVKSGFPPPFFVSLCWHLSGSEDCCLPVAVVRDRPSRIVKHLLLASHNNYKHPQTGKIHLPRATAFKKKNEHLFLIAAVKLLYFCFTLAFFKNWNCSLIQAFLNKKGRELFNGLVRVLEYIHHLQKSFNVHKSHLNSWKGLLAQPLNIIWCPP